MFNDAPQTIPSKNLDVNKQIFMERPIGKINVGRLIKILSYINIAILFILFIFTSLVCLHTFKKSEGFYSENGLNSGGIALIVFDVIYLVTALILQLYIWKYKIELKKGFGKKIFWVLILSTFLFMLFGISDTSSLPWITTNDKGAWNHTGGWWLILGIFIGILIYQIVILLSVILPHKVKHKLSKTFKPKERQEETKTANE